MVKFNRTIEDRLREEYFDLLPEIIRVADRLETEVRYHLLPISNQLDMFERLIVKSRIKACESSVAALQRRQEGKYFDLDQPELYRLTSLNDLAGIRVLAFPSNRLVEVDEVLRALYPTWKSDHILRDGEVLAQKYFGYCAGSGKIKGEYQIVSMLTGLFWEVEHSAIYKPAPRLRGLVKLAGMQAREAAVIKALNDFNQEFEDAVRLSLEDPL